MFARKLLTQVRFYSQNAPRNTALSRGWHNAFGKYLLFTNTWTSGALMIAGDLVEQEIEYQRNMTTKRYDWARVGRMFIAGVAMGPLHHYFYGWMDRILPQRSMRSIAEKILLDQLVMSPACIALLFYTVGVLENKSAKECTQELQCKFLEVYTMDWVVWPPAQFLNFYYVPVKYQVLYINAVTMVYNVFLSYIKHRDNVVEYLKEPEIGL